MAILERHIGSSVYELPDIDGGELSVANRNAHFLNFAELLDDWSIRYPNLCNAINRLQYDEIREAGRAYVRGLTTRSARLGRELKVSLTEGEMPEVGVEFEGDHRGHPVAALCDVASVMGARIFLDEIQKAGVTHPFEDINEEGEIRTLYTSPNLPHIAIFLDECTKAGVAISTSAS